MNRIIVAFVMVAVGSWRRSVNNTPRLEVNPGDVSIIDTEALTIFIVLPKYAQ
jgi:hypothetical protein